MALPIAPPPPSSRRLPSSSSSSSVSAAASHFECAASSSSQASTSGSRIPSSPRVSRRTMSRGDDGSTREEREMFTRPRTPPVPAPRPTLMSPGKTKGSRLQIKPQMSPSSSSAPGSPTRRPTTPSKIPTRSPQLRPRIISTSSISPVGSSSSTVTLKHLPAHGSNGVPSQSQFDELGVARSSSRGSETAGIGLGSRRRGSGQATPEPVPGPAVHRRGSYAMTTSMTAPGGPDGPSRSHASHHISQTPSPTEPICGSERSTTSPRISRRGSSMHSSAPYGVYEGLLDESTIDLDETEPPSPIKSPRARLRIVTPAVSGISSSVASRDAAGDLVFTIQDSEARNQLLGRPSPPIPAKNPLRSLMRSTGEAQVPELGGPVAPVAPRFTQADGEGKKQVNRYSTMTQASAYSQPSAPNTATTQTASWPSGQTSSPEHSAPPSASLRGVNWGNRRGTIPGIDAENEAGTFVTALENRQSVMKELPDPPSFAKNPLLPLRSPSLRGEEPPTPPTAASKPRLDHRSPASPIDTVRANRAARARSQSTSSPLAALSRELAPELTTRPGLPRSPSTSLLSKRAHLIHEICTTEQSYASDMALVRDAYMLRFVRPASQHSHATSGAADFAISPGAFSDHSRRSSTFTYETADTRGTSVQDLGAPNMPPMNKSPSGMADLTSPNPNTAHVGTSYFTSPTFSTPPIGTLSTPQPSPRTSSLPPSAWNPRTSSGTVLSSADMRAVFLNLEQIAAFADELALSFEEAAGEELGGPGAVAREGEGGTDKLGQVFLDAVPRLQSLYTTYCGRHAQANSRLMELLADPAHASHLAECWALVQPHTNAWDLGSMLIKPVQRVLKYPLLFADLLACTSPVHPDYFNLRKASESARGVADEINEVKRRKDVVERVMSGSQKKREVSSSSVMSKDSKASSSSLSLAGLKRFRKDKSGSTPANSSSVDVSNPTVISPRSQGQLRELTAQMEDSEKAVRRIGTEVVKWVKSAEAMLLTEDSMMSVWTRVYQLDMADQADERILAFRKTLQQISRRSHAGLAREVETKVMPVFSKLLLIAINPRAVIAKKDHKISDYIRYCIARENGKNIDKTLSQTAHDYVALHTQLLEELPIFLEGYLRILDLALIAWAQAQAAYHLAVRNELQAFAAHWFPPVISRPELSLSGAVDLTQNGTGEGHSLDGRVIVKTWHEAWQPYADALDRFECTRHAPSRVVSRMANFRIDGATVSRTGSYNDSRGSSRSGSPSPAAAKMLRHSSSISTSSSNTWRHQRGASGTSTAQSQKELVAEPPRKRSASLMGAVQVTSQVQMLSPVRPDTRYDLLRRSHSKTEVPRYERGTQSARTSMGPPPMPPRSLTSSSTSSVNTSPYDSSSDSAANPARYSFGLPLLAVEATQPLFERFGASPPSAASSGDPIRSLPGRLVIAESQEYTSHPYVSRGSVSSQTSSIGENAGLGYGDLGEPFELQSTPRASHTAEIATQAQVPDPADGWRDEPVLYQCACVASFAPVEERRYRALRFLPMVVGDLINVLYEVGRIDELEGFPFPTIGVEDDGLLVGAAEDGSIGLVICSFLEPLRD